MYIYIYIAKILLIMIIYVFTVGFDKVQLDFLEKWPCAFQTSEILIGVKIVNHFLFLVGLSECLRLHSKIRNTRQNSFAGLNVYKPSVFSE